MVAVRAIKCLLAALWLLTAGGAAAQQVRWSAGQLCVTLSPEGYYKSIKVGKNEVLTMKDEYPVVSALDWKNEVVEPKAVAMGRDTLVCQMEDGEELRLAVASQPDYITLRVTACPKHYKALVFGPVGVKVHQQVGEVIGVAQGGGLALGMQALNAKTSAGIPPEAEAAYTARFYYSRSDTTSALRHRNAAVECTDGAVLQLSCRNRNPQSAQGMEVRQIGGCHAALAPCVADADGEMTGAGVAFFGCTQPQLMDVVERIEKMEGLPTSAHASTMENHLQEATEGKPGVKATMAQVSQIDFEEVCLRPEIADHLAVQLQFYLIEGIGPGDTTLLVRTGMYSCFAEDMPANMIRIDDEVISYRSAADTVGYVTLRGCRRGVAGKAAAHARNARGTRLWTHEAGGFYADLELQDTLAFRLARQTWQGINHVGLLGIGGCQYTGQDEYAMARMVERCWRESRSGTQFVSDTLFHYGWHIFKMVYDRPVSPGYNWEYDLKNRIDFCRRNLQPQKIGIIEIRCASDQTEATSIEEVEYVLSKSAAYDADYDLRCSEETIVQHGQMVQMKEAVILWDSLRGIAAGDTVLRQRLQAGYWHLERAPEGGCKLFPLTMSEKMLVGLPTEKDTMAGWACADGGDLEMRLHVIEGAVENPVLNLGTGQVRFTCTISAGQYLLLGADGRAVMTDADYHVLKAIEYDGMIEKQAEGGKVSVTCEKMAGQAVVQYVVRGTGIAIP